MGVTSRKSAQHDNVMAGAFLSAGLFNPEGTRLFPAEAGNLFLLYRRIAVVKQVPLYTADFFHCATCGLNVHS